MDKFELDNTNVKLKCYYETEKNYRVIDSLDACGNLCYIFFSGNGLYYPNEYEVFEQVVEVQDRYEWENIAKSEEITTCASRIIFVRDIYKTWYVNGINEKIDSIDKLLVLLRELVRGMPVITVGNSAGGYMAVIAGMELNAKRIYSFGGQFCIKDSSYWLDRYKDNPDRNKYYNIANLVAKSNVPLYYFYSVGCEQDIVQYQYLKEKEAQGRGYSFSMKSKIHGVLLVGECYRKILSLNDEAIEKLYLKYKGKKVSLVGILFDLFKVSELFYVVNIYMKKGICGVRKYLRI